MGRPSFKQPGVMEGGEPAARPYPLEYETVAGVHMAYFDLLGTQIKGLVGAVALILVTHK